MSLVAPELKSGGTGAQVRWHRSLSHVAPELVSCGTGARVMWHWSSSEVAPELKSDGASFPDSHNSLGMRLSTRLLQ